MNTAKWDTIFFIVLAIGGFTTISILLFNNQTDESKEAVALSKLRQAQELNTTIQMLVEVAYTNDTTKFNDYQKRILKAVMANDVEDALKIMAPHHRTNKIIEAGDAVLKAFEESPKNPVKP